MEFVIVLALLYAGQCLVRLPRGAVLFARPLRRWKSFPGPGWRLTHPLPSASNLVACRLPLVEAGGALHGRGASGWLSRDPWTSPGPRFEFTAGGSFDARGTRVRLAGRPFCEGCTKEHAARVAEWLERLAAAGPARLEDQLRKTLTASLLLDRLGQERERLAALTRWLRVLADLYAAGLFAGLPLLILWLGAEAALLRAWPLLALLHAATLAAFVAAHRRLAPGRTGDLLASAIGMALYPPLLLRAPHELEMNALGGYHPACVAAALLEGEQRRDFLRVELVMNASACASCEGECGLARLEGGALEELATRAGEPPSALFAPREPSDPLAECYCPACHVEYRRPGGRCNDCNLPLAAYRGREGRTGSAG